MKRFVKCASARYDGKEMTPYKGYKIEKNWELDYKGKPIPGTIQYMVIDEDDDWIGDVYKTLKEAHEYIDQVEGSCNVTASTKSMYTKFRKWYNNLTPNQREHVYKTADISGIPAPDYDKATDDMLEWLMDECELTFEPEYKEDDIPEELASRPYVFNISGVNPTWSDDILKIVEDMGGIRVYYYNANEDGILYSNRSAKYAVDSAATAKEIFKKVKERRIPVNDRNVYPQKADWDNAWNILIESYDGESQKISWHRIKGFRVPGSK